MATEADPQPRYPDEDDEDTECASGYCEEGTAFLQMHVVSEFSGWQNMDKRNDDTGHKAEGAQDLGHTMFRAFIEKHERDYTPGTPHYDMRQKLFTKRASEVLRHNSRPDRLWSAGMNHFSDRSARELRELLGWNGPAASGATAVQNGPTSFLQVSSISSIHSWGHEQDPLPVDWTWAHLNSTRHVHNQGVCGSCWAVSSVSVLQAHVEIHKPTHAKTLSVQELVSCVENPRRCGGTGACDGATAELAMEYALNYGLASTSEDAPEAVLPATDALTSAGRQGRCPKRTPSSPTEGESLLEDSGTVGSQEQLDITAPGVHYASPSAPPVPEGRGLGMRAWERLPANSYAPIMHALVERGPVAVAVFASQWFPYEQGIFDGCEKDAVIDHAVVLLGYAHDHKLGAKYWHIQNSWGPEWGEAGRIRLLRRDDDSSYCGTDAQPKEGTGCDGGPSEVQVCGMCGILYDAVVPHF